MPTVMTRGRLPRALLQVPLLALVAVGASARAQSDETSRWGTGRFPNLGAGFENVTAGFKIRFLFN